MSSYQRARRLYVWRGSAVVLLGTTFVMILGALADRITS